VDYIEKKRKIIKVPWQVFIVYAMCQSNFILSDITIMNTDDINNQQYKTHSFNEENNDIPIPFSSPQGIIHDNQIPIDEHERTNQNSADNLTVLTSNARRERILTLLVIALIALLTGN
jgi:hypothetical protein